MPLGWGFTWEGLSVAWGRRRLAELENESDIGADLRRRLTSEKEIKVDFKKPKSDFTFLHYDEEKDDVVSITESKADRDFEQYKVHQKKIADKDFHAERKKAVANWEQITTAKKDNKVTPPRKKSLSEIIKPNGFDVTISLEWALPHTAPVWPNGFGVALTPSKNLRSERAMGANGRDPNEGFVNNVSKKVSSWTGCEKGDLRIVPVNFDDDVKSEVDNQENGVPKKEEEDKKKANDDFVIRDHPWYKPTSVSAVATVGFGYCWKIGHVKKHKTVEVMRRCDSKFASSDSQYCCNASQDRTCHTEGEGPCFNDNDCNGTMKCGPAKAVDYGFATSYPYMQPGEFTKVCYKA